MMPTAKTGHNLPPKMNDEAEAILDEASNTNYTDVTPKQLKSRYPTDEWLGRFYNAVSR